MNSPFAPSPVSAQHAENIIATLNDMHTELEIANCLKAIEVLAKETEKYNKYFTNYMKSNVTSPSHQVIEKAYKRKAERLNKIIARLDKYDS